MNTTLTTPGRLHHQPETENLRLPELPVRRVGLADRAALHLGVALIKWGRRPGTSPSRERRANRVELALLNRDRQHALASLGRQDLTLDYTSQLAPLR